MRILLAVHHFPPRYASGAELRAYRSAVSLRKHGHEACVVCIEYIDRGPDDGVLWQDDEYEALSVRRLSFDMSRAPDQFRWEYDNPWIEKHIRDYLRQLRPDVVHLISGYLLGVGVVRAAKALDIPVVITLTDFWFVCPRLNMLRPNGELCTCRQFDALACVRCRFEEKRRYRIPGKVAPGAADWFWAHIPGSGWGRLLGCVNAADMFRRRDDTLLEALSGADALVCPARMLIDRFSARGIESHKMILNTHGIDRSSWLPVPHTKGPNHVFRIGYMGQISPHKGVHLLVNAFRQLRSESPLELVIYGNDQAFPNFTRHLRKAAHGDKRIKMPGRYAYQRLAQILAEIDVLVVPSTWNEIGPWVLYEAFATKTPVVASDIPNMSDVIQHGKNGLLFACGDSVDLAGRLQQLIDHPDLLHRLREAIGPVKTIDDEQRAMQQVYHSVLARPGRRGAEP